MSAPQGHDAVLTRLAVDLKREAKPAATAAAATASAVDLIPDAEAASLTIRVRRGGFLTLSSTSEVARAADHLQYLLREGPCVDASAGDGWYRSGDLEREARWPQWAPRAHRELGVGSLLSIQLSAEEQPFGALNLYSAQPGHFRDRDEVDFAILYAAHVAIALTTARQVANLENSLQSRHQIGVAQGILMARYDLDLDQAFQLLRRYSNTMNVKLAELSGEIVEHRRLPDRPTQDRGDTPTST